MGTNYPPQNGFDEDFCFIPPRGCMDAPGSEGAAFISLSNILSVYLFFWLNNREGRSFLGGQLLLLETMAAVDLA